MDRKRGARLTGRGSAGAPAPSSIIVHTESSKLGYRTPFEAQVYTMELLGGFGPDGVMSILICPLMPEA